MPRAGLTPERLAVAGAELADEVGFEQVTVSAVARAFDVKVASLYSHVKSSNDLKTRIALLALEEMADQAADAVAGRSGRDALTAFANVYRNYARSTPWSVRRVTDAPHPGGRSCERGLQTLADDAIDSARVQPHRSRSDPRSSVARQRFSWVRQPRVGWIVQPQCTGQRRKLGKNPRGTRFDADQLASVESMTRHAFCEQSSCATW